MCVCYKVKIFSIVLQKKCNILATKKNWKYDTTIYPENSVTSEPNIASAALSAIKN